MQNIHDKYIMIFSNLLNKGSPLKVLNSFLTELGVDVICSQPFNDTNVWGKIPVRLK